MASRPVAFDPTQLRATYGAAGTAFVELAGRAPDGAWDHPGLGEWTVRNLEHAFDYARVFRLGHAAQRRSRTVAARRSASSASILSRSSPNGETPR